MSEITDENIKSFQEKLLQWFALYKRDFPWREDSATEYEKIISEVLLQRTKAETVAKFFPTFLRIYPSWGYLVAASLEDIEETLKPIGLYKQRAERLKALANEMRNRKYKLPQVINDLNDLPMFGQYITNAAKLLIYKEPAPLLDVNMARVLERYFGKRKLADIRYDPYLQDLAHKIVNHVRTKELNWAILDFAALICVARNPKCEICIINTKCNFYNYVRYHS